MSVLDRMQVLLGPSHLANIMLLVRRVGLLPVALLPHSCSEGHQRYALPCPRLDLAMPLQDHRPVKLFSHLEQL